MTVEQTLPNEQTPRPVWSVVGEWPNLTLHPSVKCGCDGQHGWVRDGVWVAA
jgi:hypothetical protein